MTAPVIEIGTAGEVGVFFGGIMIGIGAAVKTIKWIRGFAKARDETPRMYYSDEKSNGRNYITAEDHRRLCDLSGRATNSALRGIQEELRESSRQRVAEVQRLFDKMDYNHKEIKDQIGIHGERIATLEARLEMKHGNQIR